MAASNVNNYQTCLGCGNRSRKGTCILCPDCDKMFNVLLDKSVDALLNDKMDEIVPVHDKFQYVIDLAEGKMSNPNGLKTGTLQFLEERVESAEDDLHLEEGILWEKACDEIMEKVKDQSVGQRVIDKAAGSLLEKKKKESEDYTEMSRKAFGYRRAFEAGKSFLKEVKVKRAEFLKKKVAERESERAQAEKQRQQGVPAAEEETASVV